MKYTKHFLHGIYIALYVGAIFIPIFAINNVAKSPFLIIFSDFSIYSFLTFLPYILCIISGIFFLFEDKNSKFLTIGLVLNLLGAIMLFFAGQIYSGALEEEISLKLFPTTYILFGISCLYEIYLLYFIFQKNSFSVKDIVEIAMLIALAIILDLPFLKIKIVENGGSISFVMVPLMIIALRHNFIKSFISIGVIFGLTTCLFDGYGFFTFPFDYLLGFGSIAIVSIFSKYILQNNKFSFKNIAFLFASFLIAMIGRTLSSTISGILFYGLDFWGSLVYQLTYIGPSMAVCFIAILLLFKPLLIINKIYPSKNINI